ncbi:hypothetical protein [Microbacterium sp. Leaf159]|uniref:hypothetical protein n=1 Tax=Microbacterium sp. Leaf159 TaxID=1736279 RepID=UPI000715CE34|nr:hypothetical protein [Microbacterium sp. Leaf159]KQR39761.1 hypothetical protein ASF80_10355 [Microbacterium sp. Leaf159]
MSIQIPVHVTSFMRVEFTTADHPEFDRAITMPQTAPMEWIVDAYLLSIGREPSENPEFDDDSDDYYERPRPVPESLDRWRMAMPALDHRPDVIVRTVDAPPLGAPLVAASSSTTSPAAQGDWLTQAAPFREDDVNRELMRRHGVVMPYFDDRDMRDVDPRIRRSSRIATLLSGLTPARRLALLAHIDAIGLLRESVPDRAMVETAVAPLAGLVRFLGGTGVAQDPVTGWISDSDVERLTRSLGWNGGPDDPYQWGEVVVRFARRAKLIRRLKGRVVATTYAKNFVQPTRGTLVALAGKIGTATRERFGMPLPRRDAEGALALLAIADGTAHNLDELVSHVAAGAALLDPTDSIFGSDRFDMILASGIGDDVGDKSEEITRLMEGFASLSGPKQFGVVTPAMREVARCALV